MAQSTELLEFLQIGLINFTIVHADEIIRLICLLELGTGRIIDGAIVRNHTNLVVFLSVSR